MTSSAYTEVRSSRRSKAPATISAAAISLAAGAFLTGCGGGGNAGLQDVGTTSPTRSVLKANVNSPIVSGTAQNNNSNGTNANNNGGINNSPPASVLIHAITAANAAAVASDNGVTITDSDAESGSYQLTVPPGQNANGFAQQLAHDARLTDAEVNVPVGLAETGGQSIHLAFDGGGAADPLYESISASSTINQQAYQQIDLGAPQNLPRGAGITVAVLDTGVMSAHPNLISHLVPGYNAVLRSALPEDVADGVTNSAWGHGTMVTGIITRLVPDAKVMPVRVLDGDGNGRLLNVIRGIEYASDHGARVLNLSLDTAQYSKNLDRVVQKAIASGVVIVAAAGNEATSAPHYPASLSGVIGVASVESDDTLSTYSNFAGNATLVAPGSTIRSTYINGGYASWSGTSFSAPFASAATAMTLSANPSLSGPAATALLENAGRSLDIQNPTYIGQLGYGELDIAQAIAAASRQ